MTVIPGTHLDDVSEFQSINWDIYATVRKAAIIRACYGQWHDDQQWHANHPARDGRLKVCGIYLYFVAGQDAAAQANHFCDMVGPLRDGEFLIVDAEEGGGDQQGRLDTALAIIGQRSGRAGAEYSYVPFIEAHLGGFEINGPHLRWIAGYGPEPVIPWDLWQHTDGSVGNHDCQPAYPGAPACDCSVYRGTVDELYAAVMGAPAPPAPAPPPPPPPLPPTVTVQGDPDVAQIVPLNITTDANGNGDASIAQPPGKVFAVTANGSDPEANHAYSPIPRLSKSAFNTGTKIELEGGPSSATVLVWVTVGS